MYNKVYFSDGIGVTLSCNCPSGGCSAAVSPHLVWDMVGLQISFVCAALCDGCRSSVSLYSVNAYVMTFFPYLTSCSAFFS